MDWEWNPDIHLDADVNVLLCITKHDLRAWKLFSVLSKDLCKTFNPLSYELQFRETKEFSNRKEYHLDDKLHRTDGPAVEYFNGDKSWWVDDKCHRTDGPAIELISGYKSWYVDSKLHRTDGPAVEFVNGDKSWYVDGKRHRTDGPAVEYSNNAKEWWVNGKQYSQEDFMKAIALNSFTNS